jgi:hypothetical protein
MANTKHTDDKPPVPPTADDAAKPPADDGAKPRTRAAQTDEGAGTTAAKERQATEDAERQAKEGHPEPLAQIHLINDGGVPGIRAALDSLPAIPALDGLKANWETYSRDELVKALTTLPLPKDNEAALATRDSIVARLKSGELRK